MITAIAVVGAGQVAAVAARTLRRRGFDGRIDIIGDEPHRPYQRPPLTKEYLTGGDEDGLFLLPEHWCERNDVHLRLGSPVAAVRPGRVELAGGEEVAADRVLIATGGAPRRLPGVTGERIHYLRTLDDSERLRPLLRPGARILVIGGGFLGSEVAAAARAKGAEAVLIEALNAPLARVVGADIGAVCAELYRSEGVEVHLGEQVESIDDAADGVVVTTATHRFEGDAVVVGIGMVANTGVAERSGIAVDNGILVDEYCRTSMPDVFAAGDVANHFHPAYGHRVRVEHFDNASKQAAAAANAMLGRGRAYDEPHWCWSDQYDHTLHYTGHAASWDEVVVRGSTADHDFVAFFLRDGVLRAAFGIDRGGEITAARQLIGRRVPVHVLKDEDVDLEEQL
ncbi:NAD(P)/FAD-dependent oxidoreductase [Amycolatopsis alkalitolerans]|uniref:Pyridine nucleotide-disulfide oxidoreductase n=1 Tax=Amycolatopsis alkalitolerans TaxID=2547244 RepID=A0A5C4LZB8_9PSEU|nr:FAD-dependent oxidoreductase [Amycolatopsis alkalitolerans]TNC23429.1 pyridine nucleotide-disulfide oxidoreductase [Amycolatopsis alkalitolerans]